MASGLMVPHSFPGLLEDTWPGIPQWSTLVLHHTCTCRRQQSRQVLQLSRLLFARLPNMHCCLQLMSMVWRCQLGLAPTYLIDLCRPVSGRYLRSSERGLLSVPFARTTIMQSRACSVVAPT